MLGSMTRALQNLQSARLYKLGNVAPNDCVQVFSCQIFEIQPLARRPFWAARLLSLLRSAAWFDISFPSLEGLQVPQLRFH